MTTHVFVVDEQTFPVHLQYMFAGTGAKEYDVDFNGRERSQLWPKQEKTLVEMMADAGRLRAGDQVVFYLQRGDKRDGSFFGMFRARETGSFLDHNDERNYLKDKLGKALTFRALLDPDDAVYPVGVTEWEALDEIRHIDAPYQMLWSLIYRKLKGKRGNTMITTYEAERLAQLIRDKNGRESLRPGNRGLTFNAETGRIEIGAAKRQSYVGRQELLDILPRLRWKCKARQAFEVHLQAYITGNLGRGTNKSLDLALLDGRELEWLGNEVSCGVGTQRIDVMPVVKKVRQRVVVPIELKRAPAVESAVHQLRRYVEWVKQYFVPNCQADILPTIVAKKPATADAGFAGALKEFNLAYRDRCLPIRYVEFELQGHGLSFASVAY